jgi:hypothetical protein
VCAVRGTRPNGQLAADDPEALSHAHKPKAAAFNAIQIKPDAIIRHTQSHQSRYSCKLNIYVSRPAVFAHIAKRFLNYAE